MKNFHTLLSLLLLPFLSFAQEISISEEISIYNDISYELIGEIKGQTLLFRDKNGSFEVQSFNKQLHFSWKRELALDKKNPKPLGITADKKHFTLFYQFKKKGRTQLKVNKYDSAANLRDSVTIKTFDFMTLTPTFDIIQSKDKSKVLLYYLQKQEKYTAICFSVDSMKVLWEKEFTPKKSYRENFFQQMLVSNEGTMFFVMKKNNFFNRKKKHHYKIHHYNGSGDLENFSVSMEDKLTFDSWFSYDDLNKRIIAGGFFSEKNTGKARGYFYINVDPMNPENPVVHFENFEIEFMAKFLDKKPRKKLGIIDTEIHANVIRRDGGILLFAERIKEYSRAVPEVSSSRNSSFKSNADMYHDNIMVLSIHPTGKLHWKTILYKKQYAQNDEGVFSSYFLFKTKGSLHLFFNDQISAQNTVSEYVLNGKGNSDRNSIMNTEGLKIQLRFQDAIQLNNNRLLIPSEYRSRLKLVRFDF